MGGGGGMGGGAGYGSIVDAGSVLVALTPSAQLVVFEPNGKEYKQLASYKVAEGGTHAYPVLSGNRIFIKDKDSVTLWTVE
jgi:outer membrane protein assembly factor BamB